MNFQIRLEAVDDQMTGVFAIKVVPLQSDAMHSLAINEVELLRKLHGSPHLIQMYQW